MENKKKEMSPNILAVAGPNSKYNMAGAEPAGFFAGFWHGFIIILSFLVSLFTPKVKIYEINNTGGWYDFGFLLGLGTFSGCRVLLW